MPNLICFLLGHRWSEPWTAEVGPVNFDDGQGDQRWTFRQCERCFVCKDIEEKS